MSRPTKRLEPSRRHRALEAARHLNRRYAPWLSLVAGAATAVLWREGVDWIRASVVMASLAGAVWLVFLFPPWRRRGAAWLQGAAWFAAVNLAQSALWFVIPFYVLSTTWPSRNAPFSILLVGLGALSCFDAFLRDRVLRGGLSAVAFLVPAILAAMQLFLPILTGVPPRFTVFAAGAVTALAAAVLLRADPAAPVRAPRLGLVPALAVALAGALAARAALPLLPPAPLRIAQARFALGRDGLEPVASVAWLEAGPGAPAYVFMAVEAPRGLRERVRLVVDTEEGSRETRPLAIEGGRAGGYRLWAPVPRDTAGRVRATIRTLGGQIVGETGVPVVARVEAPPLVSPRR